VLRSLYLGWSALLFLLILVQVGFAGYGAFAVGSDVEDGGTVNQDGFEDLFGLHAGFGFVVVLAGLVFAVLGAAAGIGRWRLGRHGLLFLLLIVQVLLAGLGSETPEIGGFLHAVNALLIFGLAGWIAWNEWRSSRTLGRGAAST
jgi:hypothetical protein